MPQHVCPSSMAPKFQDRLRTQDPDVLESLKVSGALCDVILVVAGQEFKAHKVILAACSPFFKSLLQRNKHEPGCMCFSKQGPLNFYSLYRSIVILLVMHKEFMIVNNYIKKFTQIVTM